MPICCSHTSPSSTTSRSGHWYGEFPSRRRGAALRPRSSALALLTCLRRSPRSSPGGRHTGGAPPPGPPPPAPGAWRWGERLAPLDAKSPLLVRAEVRGHVGDFPGASLLV